MSLTKYAGLALALAASGSTVQAQLAVRTVVTGLGETLALTQDPTNQNVFFAVQKTGEIRVIVGGVVQSTDFLDISNEITTDGERGLLGMTFAPDYATSRRLYVDYTDLQGDTHIARFTRSGNNSLLVDPNSEYPIIVIPQAGGFNNHKGGTLKFGDDGYLYIGMGDGGSSYDPQNNAQNYFSLLGKMLRIDPSRDAFPDDPNRNYAIPISNPFAIQSQFIARSELWAAGYRNPFKWSFDYARLGGTGAMLVGDVGQDRYEEVDYERMSMGGRNYGWRLQEGFHQTGIISSGGRRLTPPIFEYAHNGAGKAIIGGYIYRGSALDSPFYGRYFFADFVDSKLYSIHVIVGSNGEATASDLQDHTSQIGGSGVINSITSIDEDSGGELYFTLLSGTIVKLVHG